VPNLIGDGAEVVADDEVNFGLLPAAMAAGVLQAGVTEGGEGGAGSFQGDDVVLLLPLVGEERPCTGGLTGGRATAELGAHRRCGGWCYGARNRNWTGGGVPVGHGDALVALD
jgi:hypothetical protein